MNLANLAPVQIEASKHGVSIHHHEHWYQQPLGIVVIVALVIAMFALIVASRRTA